MTTMVETILVNFRIEPELKERLEQQAEKEHRNLSALIRHIALTYLEAQEDKKKRK